MRRGMSTCMATRSASRRRGWINEAQQGISHEGIVIREFGGPEVLRWEDVPTPTPGPGEVVIQVHAVSVNRTLDLQVRQDGGNYGVTLPLVLGNDPSGVVAALGAEAEGVK